MATNYSVPLSDGFNQAMQNYQQTINNQLNQQLPFIKTPPEVAATIGDYTVWVVTKVDEEGNGQVRAIFSTEKQADSFAANNDCDSYEYMDITPFILDVEVSKDDVDKTE